MKLLVLGASGGCGQWLVRLAEVHPLIRWMIGYSNMATSYADLQGMETILAASTLDWMAVRPTKLRDSPLQARPIFSITTAC